MKLFMRVTNDKYELPMCPPMRARELASIYGVTMMDIWKSAGRNKYRKYQRAGTAMSFVQVNLEREDEENDS